MTLSPLSPLIKALRRTETIRQAPQERKGNAIETVPPKTSPTAFGWTLETLSAHISQRLDDRAHLADTRFEMLEKSLTLALRCQEASMTAALNCAERAVAKAEAAMEKRFDGVNEFRETLSDQASLFMTRTEMLSLVESVREKIEVNVTRMGDLAPRSEMDSTIASLDSKLSAHFESVLTKCDSLSLRVTAAEGRGTGLHQGWGFLVGAVGLTAAVIAIVVQILHIVK